MGRGCDIGVHERNPVGGAVNHFGSRDALPTWEFSDMRSEMVEFILGWQDSKWTGGISDWALATMHRVLTARGLTS